MTSGNERRELLAAAVQFNPAHGQPARNRKAMAALLREAAGRGAKLIVFPEMASSGYVWENRAEIAPHAETIPGPTTDALQAAAADCDCYAVVGLPERDPRTGAYYNSAALIGPQGVIGVYRKTHLFAADPRWAREGGEGVRVWRTSIGAIAMLICMDAMYFEPARLAALQEADIVAFPTNWVGGGNNPPSNTWRLRARENGLYWVAANRSDEERGAQFTGGSGIIGPDGEVRQSLVAGEGIVYGAVAAGGADRERRRLMMAARRPGAYQDLLLHPYLWQEGETRPIAEPQPFEVALVPHRSGGGADDAAADDSAADDAAAVEASLARVAALRRREERRLLVLPRLTVAARPGAADEALAGLARLAARYGGCIVAALAEPERLDGLEAAPAPPAATYLVGPDGPIGRALPVHAAASAPRAADEEAAFRVFELPFARVGVLAGADAGCPESYRALAKQGADVIAVSAGGREAGEPWMRRIWAFENDAALAVAAPPASDGSLLFLHRRVHLEGRTEERPFAHRFSPEELAAARRRPFLRRLKTHLYDKLVQAEREGETE